MLRPLRAVASLCRVMVRVWSWPAALLPATVMAWSSEPLVNAV